MTKIVPNGYNSFKVVNTDSSNPTKTLACFVITAGICVVAGFALPNDFQLAKAILLGLVVILASIGMIAGIVTTK